MADPVVFTVHGEPAPQGSKTVARTKAGRSFVREDNPATEPWRNAVATVAAHAMSGRTPFAGPVELDVVFCFPRPRSHYGSGRNAAKLKGSAPNLHTTRPDVDKLLRAIGDALAGVVLVDDAQIAQVRAAKHYGAPAAHVTVTELGGR